MIPFESCDEVAGGSESPVSAQALRVSHELETVPDSVDVSEQIYSAIE